MIDHHNEFRRRWNIPILEEEIFPKFKIGVNNNFKSNLKHVYAPALNSIFCKRALVNDFEGSIYDVSDISKKISSSKDLPNLLLYSEIIIDILKDAIRHPKIINSEINRIDLKKAKKVIISEFEELIKILPINVVMKEEKKSILFYPSGAKLLDEKLINDPLDWLLDYPKAYSNFKMALEKYQKKVYKRSLLDDLRNSLEIFLKKYLDNQKSLEKQKELLEYMKNKNVSPEITSMFWTLLDRYSKYQNEYVKHDDNIKEQEIEFIIYLTGSFIRFLITLKDK